ncbi:hypothetical protein NLM33_41610 [Bradyrhizobium sp. CCGUVB1N3]|uniref:beta strand repeat-containing protein n=1 Tax=Bradyrhizobium sp. CCGUVB1N3 TaxID=2949629 RepID=UPI0020B187AE|nr:hypothetical protein [Bradyrhizobium sp. CCGUVB1N3]MCP3476668.1 hypothetical protein [Bradyrhizobium sp. CCGUVB1N3]
MNSRDALRAAVVLTTLAGTLCPTTASSQFASRPGYSVGTAGAVCDGSNMLYGWPDANGQLLKCSSNVWSIVTQTAGAAGSNAQVQFNSGGALAGDSGLTYVNPNLTIGYGSLYIGTSVATAGALFIGGMNRVSYPSADTYAQGSSIAIGPSALANMPAMTGGSSIYGNIAIGSQALSSASMTTAAVSNTAVGFQALRANTSGNSNTAFGTSVLAANTTGTSNTSVGAAALNLNTTGASNTAVGGGALKGNTGGGSNTAIGALSMRNTGASGNTAVGATSLYTNSSGANNTVIGSGALYNGYSGSNNTVLGYSGASATLTAGSNNILIGTNNSVDTPASGTNNFLNIGNLIYGTSIGTAATAGNVGIGTTSPMSSFHVMNSGSATSISIGNPGTGHTWGNLGTSADAGGYFLVQSVGNQGTSYGNLVLEGNGGNVGIGTTAPQTTLHILNGGSSGQSFSNNAGLIVEDNGSLNNYYVFQVATAGGGKFFNLTNAGNVGIGTTVPLNKLDVAGGHVIGAGYVGTTTAPANGLIVQGNVGIGTQTALNALDVNGGNISVNNGGMYFGYANSGSYPLRIVAPSSASVRLQIGGPGGSILFASNTASTTGVYANSGALSLYNGPLAVGTTTALNMLDVSGGSVVGAGYIGTTTAPSNGLIVQGNVGIGTTKPLNMLDVAGGHVIGAGYVGTTTAPTNGLAVQGNIALGTSAAGAALTIASAPAMALSVVNSAAASLGGITNNAVFRAQSGGAGSQGYVFTSDLNSGIGNPATGNVVVVTGSAERVRVDSSGNVGVGTNVPLASLDLSRKTDAALLPVGTTGQQPTCNSNTTGGIRYNSSTGYPEYCSGSAWIPFKVTGAPPGSGYFVLSVGTYNGNLGGYSAAGGNTGLAAANAICLSELTTNTSWWGYTTANAAGILTSSHVFAFLCDGTSCNTPAASTTYYYGNANDVSAGGGTFTTDASGLGPNDSAAWTLGYRWGGAGTTGGIAWTGRGTSTNTAWPSTSSASACTAWTSSSSGVSGVIAQPGFTDYHRWGSATATCDQSRRLICYVNP